LVDDTLHEGRIEIELTSNEPARHHRRAAHRSGSPVEIAGPAVAPTRPALAAPASAERATVPPGRNRLLGVAAGAGVAGLLVGWLAGSAGGDGGTLEPAATVATVPTAGNGPQPSFGENPSLVELDAPVLTTAADRQRPVTTPSPVVESHLLGLDSRLVGLPYEIVTAGAGGEIQYVDLARGMITVVDGPASANTGMLFAGDTWTLVPSGPTGGALLYDDGDPVPRRIENVEPWVLFGIPGSPTLWMPTDDVQMGRPGQMMEVTPDLEPTGVRIDVPAAPVMIEPPGNFVVPAASGVYIVSGDGVSRLTTGRLIALGPTVALAEECDEQLTCKYVVIERATGERRDLPGLVRGAPFESVGWWAQSSQTISPDGGFAMVLLAEYERLTDRGGHMVTPRLAVVDLVTGQTTPLTEATGGIQSVVRWTADSQFAFFMTDGEVFAYVAGTGELLRAEPDDVSAIRPQAFDLRPSAGTSLLRPDRPGDTVTETTTNP
jgi:hypothetical protein